VFDEDDGSEGNGSYSMFPVHALYYFFVSLPTSSITHSSKIINVLSILVDSDTNKRKNKFKNNKYNIS